MPSIFMSHTSVDKPFVEKLVKDMKKYGIHIWYDKYEIRVGESIFWKIDEGIRDMDYVGIVISKEAWESEWVKKEFSAAWTKQMKLGRTVLLPIFYRECEIPIMLQDTKYADFRTDYESGLKELLATFGIKNMDVIGEDSWRKFVGRDPAWKTFQREEFEKIITNCCKMAREHNFGIWTGGSKSPFSACFSMFNQRNGIRAFSIRMLPTKDYQYYGVITSETNPNNISSSCYSQLIGSKSNEVEEYVWNQMCKMREMYGENEGKAYIATSRFLSGEQKREAISDFIRKMDWNQDIDVGYGR